MATNSICPNIHKNLVSKINSNSSIEIMCTCHYLFILVTYPLLHSREYDFSLIKTKIEIE